MYGYSSLCSYQFHILEAIQAVLNDTMFLQFQQKMYACERLISSYHDWPVGGSVNAGATND